MSDSPTEDRPDKPQGYSGEERRKGERRVGERRIADRRRADSTAVGPDGEKLAADAAARERERSRFWYDFLRFNLTGWSVVVPTLAGLAIGNWIDNRYPTSFSWALVLMGIGLFLGCLNAWYWIRRQDSGVKR